MRLEGLGELGKMGNLGVMARTGGDVITPTKNWVDNPSFEVSAANWSLSGTGTALTRVTGDGVYGSSCGMLTSSVDVNSRIYRDCPTLVSGSDAGYDAIISVWAKAGTHDKMAISVDGYISPTFTLTSEWVRYTYIKVGGWRTRVYIFGKQPFNTSQSGTIYIDAIQYEIQPTGRVTATDYCDGDQPGCVWLGTTGLSQSTRGTPVLPF